MKPVDAFTASIWAKKQALETRPLSRVAERRLRESIGDDIRKWSDLIPHCVSARAAKWAARQRPALDLKTKTWHDQNKFDKHRKALIVEHYATVKSLRERCIGAKSERAVRRILEREVVVVWITRDEDERLAGARSNRPDPAEAYKNAGITIVEPCAKAARRPRTRAS